MPGNREGARAPRENMRGLLPNAFGFFEQVKEKAVQVAFDLGRISRERDLKPDETKKLNAADKEAYFCDEMFQELEVGNTGYVISYLESLLLKRLEERRLDSEETGKLGYVISELKQAKTKMLH